MTYYSILYLIVFIFQNVIFGPVLNTVYKSCANLTLSSPNLHIMMNAVLFFCQSKPLAQVNETQDGWMDGSMDGWTDGWMDGWTDQWMNGWMDGWMDG